MAAANARNIDLRDQPPSETGLTTRSLPDVPLTTSTGARTTLATVARGRPLLLTFVFARCVGVCSPFLRSWAAADRSLGRGDAYARLVLSFDPRDTAADMAMMAHHMGLGEHGREWTFAVAEPADVHHLSDAVGFWWDWDERRQQYDHPALLAAVRDGRLVRLLVGGSITTAGLNDMVREMSGEFVRSYPLPGRVSFRCVRYNAAMGRMSLDWGFAILLLPPFATVGATWALFAYGARARREPRPSGGVET
jgi:cytochrome oxidase Cu insertion factor (SCO1/SenC/PrrC family)